MAWTGIQIIGSYLDKLALGLHNREIRIESIVEKVNPITIMFEPDKEKAVNCKGMEDESACLDIKKNLSNMLTRNPVLFDSNMDVQGLNKDVRYFNTSEWILVHNNYVNSKLIMAGDTLYTYRSPFNEFLKKLEQDGSPVLDFTYLKEIDWKKHYDKFIQTIMEQYDSEHIILLRNSISPWYMDESGIQVMETYDADYRKLVEEMDMYFYEKTNCLFINNFFAGVPNGITESPEPEALRDGVELDRLADKISKLIHEGDKDQFDSVWFSSVEKNLTEYYFEILENGLSPQTFELIEAYAAQGIDSISDIVAIYKLYTEWNREYDFSGIIYSIVSNENTLLRREQERLFEHNKKYLQKYPYIPNNINYVTEETNVYVKIGNGFYFKITADEICAIELVQEEKEYSGLEIIKNGLQCSWKYAESLCSDLRFYLERARQALGNQPVRILFEDDKEFIRSLYLVNWYEILESERFAFVVKGESVGLKDYQVRTNLSFLFDGVVHLYVLGSGFADQIKHYLGGMVLEEQEEKKVYYDDIIYKKRFGVMNVYKLSELFKSSVSERFLSNILSPNLLRDNFLSEEGFYQHADALFNEGLKEIVFITDHLERYQTVKDATRVMVQGRQNREIMRTIPGGIKYFCISPQRDFSREFCKKYLEFPEFTTKINMRLKEEMLACDAVAIHVRRGDYVKFGIAGAHFYKNSLEILHHMPKYSNKRYYIFSDDIPWCHANKEALGLSNIPEGKLCFIDHNKNEDSWRDMHLLQYAKIVIGSLSGFAYSVKFFSDRLEVFIRQKELEKNDSSTTEYNNMILIEYCKSDSEFTVD